MGIQIVGSYLEDRTPIHAALLMDELFGGFVRPPHEALGLTPQQ